VNLDAARQLARRASLYPSLILHGGDAEARRAAALDLARILLCEKPPEERPCGTCRHCRRLAWPGDEGGAFHPDFLVLERDLKTSTSVDAARTLLRASRVSPFEARGQVFVVAAADTLSGEAGDALLKALEEPAAGAPRNYLLLAPSQYDLLPTLRSRSLAVYLGAAAPLSDDDLAAPAQELAQCLAAYDDGASPLFLLLAAEVLLDAGGSAEGGWDDPRAGRPWTVAAAVAGRAAVRAAGSTAPPLSRRLRRALLELASSLLESPPLRLRGVPAQRIVEGLVCHHLALGSAAGTVAVRPSGVGGDMPLHLRVRRMLEEA
jgi:hypothetical protein